MLFDFVDGGAENEVTLRANRQAFDDVTFRPRMALPISQPDLSTTVLGTNVSMPVLLAPCGANRTIHPDGECGVARAAGRAGTIALLSTASGFPLEDVIAQATGPMWFQLYFLGGRAGAEVLVERAAKAGFEALVVTVDTPVIGNRERDNRHGLTLPLAIDVRSAVHFAPQVVTHPLWSWRFARDGFPARQANIDRLGADGGAVSHVTATAAMYANPPTWADLAWIRRQWAGPLVVKGVLTGDDARRAADTGADAVVVSNHGGRQLDGAPATLTALPEIVDAVGGDIEVLLDSGVTRGGDVAKAVALGARAVLVGRAYLYGLAAAGETGVDRILAILRAELARTLCLLGCPSVGDLDTGFVQAARRI